MSPAESAAPAIAGPPPPTTVQPRQEDGAARATTSRGSSHTSPTMSADSRPRSLTLMPFFRAQARIACVRCRSPRPEERPRRAPTLRTRRPAAAKEVMPSRSCLPCRVQTSISYDVPSRPNGTVSSPGLSPPQRSDLGYWHPTYPRLNRSGTYSDVNYNKPDAVRRLAMTEFNTAYVRAVATVGLRRSFQTGELYRAGDAEEKRARCVEREGQQVPLQGLLDDFRCYFPGPVLPTALPLPAGPNCHHSIRLMG
jgi:hypothetical protein